MNAKPLEPQVLRAARFALGEYQRVILVQGKQAFSATRGSQHRHRIPARGRAVAGVVHALFGQGSRLASECAKLMGNDGGQITSTHILVEQGSNDLWQFPPGNTKRVDVGGLVDLVAERHRVACAQPQQVARRQRTDHVTGSVDHTEMTNAKPAHPTNGAVDEGVGRHHCQRTAHRRRHWHIERDCTVPGKRAQYVALR